MRVMVALYCTSYDKPPASVTLDIDDTLDVVDGPVVKARDRLDALAAAQEISALLERMNDKSSGTPIRARSPSAVSVWERGNFSTRSWLWPC